MEHRYGPRRKNLNIPGHAHELTFSCYQRYKFLEAERTQQWLGEAIKDLNGDAAALSRPSTSPLKPAEFAPGGPIAYTMQDVDLPIATEGVARRLWRRPPRTPSLFLQVQPP